MPIRLLSILSEFLDKQNELFYRIETSDECLIKYIDSDPTSSFFFSILNYTVDTGDNISLQLEYKPASDADVNLRSITVYSPSLIDHFNNWVGMLRKYNELRSPFDVNFIEQQYEDEFLQEFEIVNDDKDSDRNSYDLDTQKKIDRYLSDVLIKLDEVRNETNLKEIDSLKNEVEHLKNVQTKLTKKVFIQRFSKIAAKARKIGLEVLKWIATEALKEIAKEAIKGYISN